MLGLGLGIGLGLSFDSPTQANTNPALGMANLINLVLYMCGSLRSLAPSIMIHYCGKLFQRDCY